jgi:hypothetical protein
MEERVLTQTDFANDDYADIPGNEKPYVFIGVSAMTVGLVDRLFGGPEEGGWWYDTFMPLRTFYVPTKQLPELKRRLEKVVKHMNVIEGRRPISSVLSDGYYVLLNGMVEAYPIERPHYE